MNKYMVKLVSGEVVPVLADTYYLLGSLYCFIAYGDVIKAYQAEEVESIEDTSKAED